MHTIWGQAQTTTTLATGVTWVTTASHGGLLVTRAAAVRHLTPEARAFAQRSGDCEAYEEDCCCSIPFFEHPEWEAALRAHNGANITIDAITQAAHQSISLWFPMYLLARKIEPDMTAYTQWRERRERDRLHDAKSPDLIVCAWGHPYKDVPPGAVRVKTADDQLHVVTQASYDASTGVNLLSKCQPFALA